VCNRLIITPFLLFTYETRGPKLEHLLAATATRLGTPKRIDWGLASIIVTNSLIRTITDIMRRARHWRDAKAQGRFHIISFSIECCWGATVPLIRDQELKSVLVLTRINCSAHGQQVGTGGIATAISACRKIRFGSGCSLSWSQIVAWQQHFLNF